MGEAMTEKQKENLPGAEAYSEASRAKMKMAAAQENEKLNHPDAAAVQFRQEAVFRLLIENHPDVNGAFKACKNSARCYKKSNDTDNAQTLLKCAEKLTKAHDLHDVVVILKDLRGPHDKY
jgi:hypothetical protein